MLLVGSLLGGGIGSFFPGLGIKELVAEIFEGAAVEGSASRFGFDFDGAGAVAAVLGAVIRGENFEFRDGFRVGIDVECGIAAIVHVVAAVQLPVVVLGASAVHAVSHVAVHTDFGVVLSRLTDHARGEVDELREVAAIEDKLANLFSGNGVA